MTATIVYRSTKPSILPGLPPINKFENIGDEDLQHLLATDEAILRGMGILRLLDENGQTVLDLA